MIKKLMCKTFIILFILSLNTISLEAKSPTQKECQDLINKIKHLESQLLGISDEKKFGDLQTEYDKLKIKYTILDGLSQINSDYADSINKIHENVDKNNTKNIAEMRKMINEGIAPISRMIQMEGFIDHLINDLPLKDLPSEEAKQNDLFNRFQKKLKLKCQQQNTPTSINKLDWKSMCNNLSNSKDENKKILKGFYNAYINHKNLYKDSDDRLKTLRNYKKVLYKTPKDTEDKLEQMAYTKKMQKDLEGHMTISHACLKIKNVNESTSCLEKAKKNISNVFDEYSKNMFKNIMIKTPLDVEGFKKDSKLKTAALNKIMKSLKHHDISTIPLSDEEKIDAENTEEVYNKLKKYIEKNPISSDPDDKKIKNYWKDLQKKYSTNNKNQLSGKLLLEVTREVKSLTVSLIDLETTNTDRMIQQNNNRDKTSLLKKDFETQLKKLKAASIEKYIGNPQTLVDTLETKATAKKRDELLEKVKVNYLIAQNRLKMYRDVKFKNDISEQMNELQLSDILKDTHSSLNCEGEINFVDKPEQSEKIMSECIKKLTGITSRLSNDDLNDLNNQKIELEKKLKQLRKLMNEYASKNNYNMLYLEKKLLINQAWKWKDKCDSELNLTDSFSREANDCTTQKNIGLNEQFLKFGNEIIASMNSIDNRKADTFNDQLKKPKQQKPSKKEKALATVPSDSDSGSGSGSDDDNEENDEAEVMKKFKERIGKMKDEYKESRKKKRIKNQKAYKEYQDQLNSVPSFETLFSDYHLVWGQNGKIASIYKKQHPAITFSRGIVGSDLFKQDNISFFTNHFTGLTGQLIESAEMYAKTQRQDESDYFQIQAALNEFDWRPYGDDTYNHYGYFGHRNPWTFSGPPE